ncbi:protein-glutamate methylesterase/protein-glutamine glutaminase [Anaeroselena agilis]|uniref:Protein-glutamate methylesterase/protein-glutamine glutaminase n=1 Tax=Anaeroselena agilis TaxID=3063788 RepID=A0ABU3NW97_9FIRM|nr:chemotaxis response regulator protein-glutamate methylesterase [Selenomonadales bacterium 4137-cl]
MKKIRVLVVDDSLLFREMLARGLATDPAVEVVATAVDPFDARDKILQYSPDVITCDVEMPKMNGIEFIRRLLPQYPLPVIVITTISETVFEAMAAGAVDFVTKPSVRSPGGIERFLTDLITKVKTAASANVSPRNPVVQRAATPAGTAAKDAIVAIGASTGGTEAIFNLVKNLPASMAGIVIVQHIPPIFSRLFAERLNSQTGFEVKEAATGDIVLPGRILVAPGDKHMKIKKTAGRYVANCFAGEKVSGHCPSVDVLFESVAAAAGKDAVGIILTGMGCDGAKGLLSMRRSGARTIGQNEASCVVFGMPKVAHNIGAVEKMVPLENIPQLLCSLLNG